MRLDTFGSPFNVLHSVSTAECEEGTVYSYDSAE